MILLFRTLIIVLVSFVSILHAQNISNINPNSGTQGQFLNVAISGQNTNFGQGTATTNVWFNQGTSTLIYPSNITIQNPSQLNAEVNFPNNAPIGYYDVNVQNSIDGLITAYYGFYLNPNPNAPQILYANPNTASPGQVLTVSVTSQNTNFTQGTSTANVWFSQGTSTLIFPDVITVVSDTKIDAVFSIPSNADSGYYHVNTYESYDGELTLYNGFYINGCAMPAQAATPAGPALLCKNSNNTQYFTNAVNATSYQWLIIPVYSGTIIGNGQIVAVDWNDNYTGNVQIKVAGINSCGTGSYSLPLAVTVSPAPVASFSYSSEGTEIIFSNASQNALEYLWDFGDNSPPDTAANPVHTFPTAGNYDVTLTASNENCSTVFTLMISITGIKEQSERGKTEIYPNPSGNGKFILETDFKESANIEITDVSGRIVLIHKINKGAQKMEINLSGFSEGIYYLKLYNPSFVKMKKLVCWF